MTTNYITTLIICCFISLFSFGQDKIVNTKKSTLSWTGNAAFDAYALTGTLKVKSGSLKIKNDTIKALKITINMKSLDHENDDLKKHLSGKDFFEVKTYAEAIFELTEPVKVCNNKAQLIGTLSIKNITKTETFLITLNDEYSNLSFDIAIDRTVYGVKFNSPSFFKKMKENAIADEFKLIGNLVLN
jgi:polyisoprenoid-binding protein YceI